MPEMPALSVTFTLSATSTAGIPTFVVAVALSLALLQRCCKAMTRTTVWLKDRVMLTVWSFSNVSFLPKAICDSDTFTCTVALIPKLALQSPALDSFAMKKIQIESPDALMLLLLSL